MKYLNLFIFVLLLAGCNRPVKHSDIIQADTMVSIIPQEDTITLSALFSRCEIVKLNDIVLASINKVFKYDSLWIVQGKSDQGGVHLFNNEGRYLKTVLKWGQGPEEAYDIWSIKLLDGSIYLLINSGTEVVEYSLQKQKMVERFRLPSEILSATDFVVDNGGNYIFLKSISREKKKEEYKLYVYNKKEGTIVNRILNMDKKSSEYISFDQSDCLYRVQDEIYYYEVFRNGICRLSANDMTGYIAFKQNEYTFPEKELYNEDHTFQSFIDVCENSPFIWAHRNLFEGERFVSSTYMYKKELFWNIIDKSDYSVHSYKWVYDDLILNEVVPVEDYLYRANVQENIHYYTLSFYDFDRIMQLKKKCKKSVGEKCMVKLDDMLDENSNDIIVCFYEKK